MKRQFNTSPTKSRGKTGYPILSKLLMTLGLSIILAISVLVFFEYGEATIEQPPPEITNSTLTTNQTWTREFESLMHQFHFSPAWARGIEKIKNSGSSNSNRFLLSLNYPVEYRIHKFIFSVIQMSKRNHYQVIETYEKFNPREISVGISTARGDYIQMNYKENSDLEWYSGKIAIIIDDFGYRSDHFVNAFFEMPYPITIAIIPGTEFAKQMAEKANQAGLNVLIHLPMEPLQGEVENKGYTIFTGMSQEEIDSTVKRALDNVPGAIGINNHMGSKATVNRTTMQRLMRSLKNRNLLFIDSITNRNSVAYQQALQAKVPTLQLTTYIDNPEKNMQLGTIMRTIVSRLSPESPAVLIGHTRDETSRILSAEMAKWARKGISFVSVFDLLEKQ